MFKQLLEKTRNLLSTSFKECSMCTEIWCTRDEFLSDPNLTIKGYMANFDHLELGIFLFDHKICKTTLAIQASQFTDMYNGPIYKRRLTGIEDCPEYCLVKKELKPCPAECECAYVREVLNKVNNWEKCE
jgi:hypothetical protein